MSTRWLVRLAVIAALGLAGCGKKPDGEHCDSADECESGYCACASACRSGCCTPPPAGTPTVCLADCTELVCEER